ncbi:MAG: hypothetical protein LLF92_07115 [Planctomycetaceae bacterium]|nr:hypothetical protein [Planctomycetaceae bacterium]
MKISTWKGSFCFIFLGFCVLNQKCYSVSSFELQSISANSESERVNAGTSSYNTNRQSYIQLLNQGIDGCRQQLPRITASAQQVALRTIAGGKLWVSGRQRDFIHEAIGRAGGLMDIRPLDVNSLRRGDSILYAVAGDLNSLDLAALRTWNHEGIYVVAFASGSLPQDINQPAATVLMKNFTSSGLPVNYNGRQMLCPIDTVLNILNLWTWTGEFTFASLREGKMPIFYQSYGLEGARLRAEKYIGKTFHEDFKIPPVMPGVLGKAYMDAIQAALNRIVINDSNALDRTVVAWHAAEPNASTAWVIGHMFPEHFQDVRAPQPIPFKSSLHEIPGVHQEFPIYGPEQFILYLGYQYAPKLLLEQITERGFTLAYLSVQSAQSPATSNIIFIDPCWSLADACVDVPNYDIAILPPSGVLNAAIYWSLLANYCQTERHRL